MVEEKEGRSKRQVKNLELERVPIPAPLSAFQTWECCLTSLGCHFPLEEDIEIMELEWQLNDII